MFNAGRLAGNYEPSFGGTSASCPVVAGVAALVLSVNPNLTQQEVRNILISTSTDMGANGFDNNFGFGRVNALAALQEISNSNLEIIGSTTVCTSNSIYNLSTTTNETISWQVSSNLEIISESQTSITIKAINSFVSGNGTISLILPNKTISKEVWVGKPERPTNITLHPYAPCLNQLIFAVAKSDYPIIEDIEFSWSGVSNYLTETPNNSTISFTTYSGIPYTETIRVTATNICGESFIFSKTFAVSNCVNPGGGGPAPLPVNFELDDNIIIFPNPTSKNVFVNLSSLANNIKEYNFQIKLFSINGSVIYENQTNQILNQINTSNFKSGIYILQLSDGEKIISKKLIIKH